MNINSPDTLKEIDDFCQFLDYVSKQKLSVSSIHDAMTTGTTKMQPFLLHQGPSYICYL